MYFNLKLTASKIFFLLQLNAKYYIVDIYAECNKDFTSSIYIMDAEIYCHKTDHIIYIE